MKPGKETLEALLALPAGEAERIVAELDAATLVRLRDDWPAWVRAGQEAPRGADWRVWLMLAGRGFGKTRAGAEWVSQLARDHPGASIALVAASFDEARGVMIEGPSGLLRVARAGEAVAWQPSRRKLVFRSGAEAFVYSGAHADSLRGPEHHFAWCDELAKWRQAEAAWDNLLLGLRLGSHPRALVTTTPRPIAALHAIIGDDASVHSGGATDDNPHVAEIFRTDMRRRYGGTKLGRQELDGELLDDLEGALWTRAGIEKGRGEAPAGLGKVVIGVDPPASIEGTCGIVACGLDANGTGTSTSLGTGYVLGDHSVGGLPPDGWAKKVAAAAEAHGARRIVAEANNGGRMVEAVLRGAGLTLPVKLVHAAEGKVARAAPVSVLFENGRARFAGRFAALEDQLCGLIWDGSYRGPGRSPDRADAMVWALTELMLGAQGAPPRIRRV